MKGLHTRVRQTSSIDDAVDGVAADAVGGDADDNDEDAEASPNNVQWRRKAS